MNYKFTFKQPPEKGSQEELFDVEQVNFQYNNRLVPKELQLAADEDMISIFEDFLLSKGESLDRKKYNNIMIGIVPIIMKIKNYFKRERPQQTADRLGLDYTFDELESASSASYPSGHTIQAYVIADFLCEEFPEYEEEFYDIAEMIAQSRIDRGVHFPTDVSYGKKIAFELLNQINFDKIIEGFKESKILKESINNKIQKRIDMLINDPLYKHVRIKIEGSDQDERYRVFYTDSQVVSGFIGFRKTNWNPSHGRCLNAWEVSFSEATPGWGALLYEIALELAGSDGLMSDRFSVSPQAKSVWDQYQSRADISKEQLDVKKDSVSWKGLKPPEQLTPDIEEDDCEQQSSVSFGGRSEWDKNSISKKYTKNNMEVINTLMAAGKIEK